MAADSADTAVECFDRRLVLHFCKLTGQVDIACNEYLVLKLHVIMEVFYKNLTILKSRQRVKYKRKADIYSKRTAKKTIPKKEKKWMKKYTIVDI